jgi:F-type H+-transporting ATPase subunit b
MEGFLGLTVPGFIGQLINFFILLGLLTFFGYKPIRRMLDERTARIKQGMDQAEAAKQEYELARRDVEKQISKARSDGQFILSQAEEAGKRLKEETKQEAKTEALAIVERARTEIEHERDRLIDELRREFIDTAILAAEKVISETLDREAHRRVIEKTLEQSASFKRMQV